MLASVASETFWLDLTHVALGLVVLACVLFVAVGAACELLDRRARAARRSDAGREGADAPTRNQGESVRAGPPRRA